MSRGRVIFWSLLLAVIALVAAAWFSFREPRAGGEPLSYWLRQGVGQGVGLDGFGMFEWNSPESEAAIREIGTKAIPVLLAKLRASDSPWKKKTYDLLNKQDFYQFEFTGDYYEKMQAIYGFKVLGSNALPALPALEQMFWDTNTSWEAARSLAQLGLVALPILRAGFTNADSLIRGAAVIGVKHNTNLTLATLSDMRQLRHDSNWLVANVASRQLIQFSSREEATRLAIEILEDNRGRSRSGVLDLFNQVSIHTNQVVPVLVNLLNDPNPRFRLSVTNALKQLDPGAAAASGIDTNPSSSFKRRSRRPAATNTPAPPQQ
jgi:hypothetical protein